MIPSVSFPAFGDPCRTRMTVEIGDEIMKSDRTSRLAIASKIEGYGRGDLGRFMVSNIVSSPRCYLCRGSEPFMKLNTKRFFMGGKRSTKYDGTLAMHWWQSVAHLIQLAPVTMALENCALLGITCGKMDTIAPLRTYQNCGV